jgi:hypothetical protein
MSLNVILRIGQQAAQLVDSLLDAVIDEFSDRLAAEATVGDEEETPATTTPGAFGIWEERLQTPDLHRSFTLFESDILSGNPPDQGPDKDYLGTWGLVGGVNGGDGPDQLIFRDTTEKALRMDVLSGNTDVPNFFFNLGDELTDASPPSQSARIGPGQSLFTTMEIKWNAAMHETFFLNRSISHAPVRFTVDSVASPAVLTIAVAPTNSEDYLTEGKRIWICGNTIIFPNFTTDPSGTLPAGLVKGGSVVYYVRNPTGGGDSIGDTCNLSLTESGALINTSEGSPSQSGNHYYTHAEPNGGVKFFDVVAGDIVGGSEPDIYYGNTHFFSSSAAKTVVFSGVNNQFRVPTMYGYSGWGGSLQDARLSETHAEKFLLFQNEWDGGSSPELDPGVSCNYVDQQAIGQGYGPTVPVDPGCWEFPAEQWTALQLGIDILSEPFLGDGGEQRVHARRRLWKADENEGWVLLIDFNQSTPGYYSLLWQDNDPVALDCWLGKVFLFPHITNRAPEQVLAGDGHGKVWYRNALSGETMFAAPMRLAANAPAVGNWREISGSNTMRDVNGADVSNQFLQTTIDNWCNGSYARHVGPYGMVINSGGGHCNINDTIFGQQLAAVDADCEWDDIFPKSDVSAFINDGAGSDPYGGINSDTSPTTPHHYDQSCAIPPSAFGNTNGAFCYWLLSAVKCDGPIARLYSWFLDLDNAGTGTPCVWSKSTNAIPANAVGVASGSVATFDPVRNCVWYFGGGAPTHIGKLDIATRTWTSIAHGNPALNTADTLTGGYCPSLDCVVWFWHNASNVNGWGPRLAVWKPNEAGDGGTMYEDATQSGTAPGNICGLEWCPHASVQKFYGMEFISVSDVTVTNASPGVVTWNNHGLTANTRIWAATVSGNVAWPSPISDGQELYVRNPTTHTFEVSATSGGASINTTGGAVGTHTINGGYPRQRMKTLTPPASLPGTWTWGEETFTAEGGATHVGNDSINPRYNAARWSWPFMSFVWANAINGKTNLLRPAAATSVDEA